MFQQMVVQQIIWRSNKQNDSAKRKDMQRYAEEVLGTLLDSVDERGTKWIAWCAENGQIIMYI